MKEPLFFCIFRQAALETNPKIPKFLSKNISGDPYVNNA